MKTLSTLILLSIAVHCQSQKKESFYVYDSAGEPTKIETAYFLLRTYQVNDTCWQWDYYKFTGPLVTSEQFKDPKGEQRHGISYHYAENGMMDSSAQFRNGKKHGDAYRLSSDDFLFKVKYVFDEDQLLETIDMMKKPEDSGIGYADEKESEFPGKAGKWARYLGNNLQYPARAINANIEGEVRVGFLVEKDGNVNGAFIAKSVEYSLDQEAIRIIKSSGKWIPAFQNGRVVKSYKMQPIVFRLR